MNPIFSVEDLDSYWQMMSPEPQFHTTEGIQFSQNLNRSASVWAFQKFIQEGIIASPETASSVAGDTSIEPQFNPMLKPEMSSDDVVEIHNHQFTSPTVSDLNGSNDCQAFLKSRLDMACAFAMSRGITANPLGSIQDDKEWLTSNPIKLGSPVLGPGDSSCMEQQKTDSGSIGITNLPVSQKKIGVQGGLTTSESSRDHSDDDDLDADTDTTGIRGDDKRVRRMQSNRESARRSRRRKQDHLNDLEKKVSLLRVEKSSLSKRFTDVNQKYNDAAVDNLVLKADIETLRAKVKMAEDTVKRATGFNTPLHFMPNMCSTLPPTIIRRPSDVAVDQFFHPQSVNILNCSPQNHLFSSQTYSVQRAGPPGSKQVCMGLNIHGPTSDALLDGKK